MKFKNFYTLVILSALVYISGLHERYIGTGLRSDIYLFYDYSTKGGRLVSNIIEEISSMLVICYLLFYITRNSVKSVSNIFYPFFWISVLDLIDYLLFFKAFAIVKLLVLIVLIFIYNFKVPPK